MAVVLAWSFAGVIVALSALLLVVGRDRERLKKTERRARLGAEHARLHLSLLARAGDEMAAALESYDGALLRLLGVVVPVFADWFAVDLVDEAGGVQRVAAAGREGPLEMPRAHPHPDGDVLVRRVIENGRDEVLANTPGPGGTGESYRHEGVLVGPDSGPQVRPAPGIGSMVIVPVDVRGLTLGALSFVTSPGRRGYRLSDLETAHGLADRLAVAIERVLLWRESREAEAAAIARAEQLRRLMEASLAVNAPLAEPEILEVLADRARQVLGVARALVFTIPRPATDSPMSEVIAAVCSPQVSPEQLGDLAPAASELVAQFDRPLRSSGASRPAGSVGPLAHDLSRGPSVEGLPEGVVLDPSRVPASGAPWMAVPVPGEPDESRRIIIVEGDPSLRPTASRVVSGGFGPEDESVLVLLAQIASVALVNADLYQAARESERRLRAVVESSPLAIAELALDGEVRWWNRASEDLLGAPGAGREPGAGWRMPVHPDSEDEWNELLERGARATATVGADIRATGPDEHVRELSVSNAPLFDHAGEVSGILVVAEDVTERRRVLEQMHQSERLAAMARLAGGVAHDFNNLLTVILGSSEMLSGREDLDESSRDEVDAIRRAGQRAAGLTAQLLAVGRHEAQPAVLDLDAELGSMLPVLERVLGDGVTLELAPAQRPERILVDPSDLERAVLNLAINARDAMPDGGRFVLSTYVEEPAQHDPAQHDPAQHDPAQHDPAQHDPAQHDPAQHDEAPSASGKFVALVASDTGEGMDPETAAHCFEPFFSTKPQGSGTGLGLFAVHAIVTQAGGRVDVGTSPGSGTTFTLCFPALDEGPTGRLDEGLTGLYDGPTGRLD